MTASSSPSETASADDDRRLGIGELLPALMMAGAVLLFLVIGSLGVRPTGQMIVIASPGTSRADLTEMVWQAKGGIAAYGGVASIAVAMSDAPDFKHRLYQNGAWLVFPSPRFLGCSSQIDGGTK